MTSSSQYIVNCPIRSLSKPSTNCTASSQCGGIDCGDGSFSPEKGTACLRCATEGPYSGFCTEGAETFGCLTPVGWIFTVGCTYLGFALFIFANLWNANFVGKVAAVRKKWQALRESESAV
mmetsp:Transcript_12344/g.19460  ORF Transcript_12344/g.19460 Transcript_12344/m.19460 type:complete len:121 (+) Transcript_12344:671-1033(+)